MEYNIHNQTFGIEIEFGRLNRNKACDLVAMVLGTNWTSVSRHLDTREMVDQKGRTWKIVYDASVDSMGSIDTHGSELVSPPLKYEDMELLQEVIRTLRKAGARVDESCGIHIHVGLQPYNVKSIKNLVKFYGKYENMLYKAVQVSPRRATGYTKKLEDIHPNLVEGMNKVKKLDDIKDIWYKDGGTGGHYNTSRYCGLNLHNVWYKGWLSGTIEFRLFNGTLHAGEIRAYITLILAISAKALNAKSINMRQANIVSDEHLFPKVLNGLGINARDEEMKNVYKHLTKHMNREWATA